MFLEKTWLRPVGDLNVKSKLRVRGHAQTAGMMRDGGGQVRVRII